MHVFKTFLMIEQNKELRSTGSNFIKLYYLHIISFEFHSNDCGLETSSRRDEYNQDNNRIIK